MQYPFPICGVHTVGRSTQTAGTVITALVPPYSAGPGGPGRIFQANPSNSTETWSKDSAFTHVMKLDYLTVTTVQTLAVIRPANWTYLTAAAAANATTLTLKDDPGIYSTNFKYQTASPPGGGAQVVPSGVADATIASGDWVAFQLKDGNWFFSAVTSYSAPTLTIATAVTNITGGGAYANTPVFLFKAVTAKDPSTGLVPVQWDTTVVTTTTRESFGDGVCPLVSSLHKGDPLLFYSPNATTAGFLGLIRSVYSREVGRAA